MRNDTHSSGRKRIILSLFCLALGATTVAAVKSGRSTAAAPLPRQADRLTVQATGRGNPYLNLTDGKPVMAEFLGDESARQTLGTNQARPTALASADFDEDGVPDLAVSSIGTEGGVLTLYRGNPDGLFPNAPEARRRKAEGTFSDAPFLDSALVIETPRIADFLGAGDFNGDGHFDLIGAGRGSAQLDFLLGDGRGSFSAPQSVMIPGAVTALTVGDINRADNVADVLVGVAASDGPKLMVFEGYEGVLKSAPEFVGMPGLVSNIAVGRLDDDPAVDFVAASGQSLIFISGRDRMLHRPPAERTSVPPPTVEPVAFPSRLMSVTVGDFLGDNRPEAAALTAEGRVFVVVPQRAAKAAGRGNLGGIRLETVLSEPISGAVRLTRAKISSLPHDELVVLDETNGIHLLSADPTPGNPEHPVPPRRLADLTSEGRPIAVLPMRLNHDGLTDLVVLKEGESVPTTIVTQPNVILTVNTTLDTGPGSLRQIMTNANSLPGADEIQFNIIGSPPFSIVPASALPTLTETVTINGTTQTGFSGTPVVEINGQNAGAANGLTFTAAATASVVRSLGINRFSQAGIAFTGGNSGFVEGNYLGLDLGGMADFGNGQRGVLIQNTSGVGVGGTTAAQRNIISGNDIQGVLITGATATGNFVIGNFIGTDAFPTGPLPNASHGVQIDSPGNTVGGPGGARNVISGNGGDGVFLLAATTNNIQGNSIGVNAGGNIAIGNTLDGIGGQGAGANLIGGVSAGLGNFISANGRHGVFFDTNANGNRLEGNRVGMDNTGQSGLQNMQHGVFINASASNAVGGTAAGAGNIISGNGGDGVLIAGASATANKVEGNFIGIDAAGTMDLGNTLEGVKIIGAPNNTVGGTNVTARNLISGNDQSGVFISGAAATGNLVQGNFIGTDAAGTSSVGNSLAGVRIFTAPNNTVGGTVGGAGNLISGNGDHGILADQSNGTIIQGNNIGLDVGVAAPVANNGNGVTINNSTTCAVGGTTPTAKNVISGNGGDGVRLFGALTTGCVVQGNAIGTNPSGTLALANGDNGVALEGGASNNTIGGTTTSARNVISGNGSAGVLLRTGTGNQVQGNFIGTNGTGTGLLGQPQGVGVEVNSGSGTVLIGGTTASPGQPPGNVISGNGVGILFPGDISGGDDVQIRGNLIGTNVTGTVGLGNVGEGVLMSSDHTNLVIGGSGGRNVISGNGGPGISLLGESTTVQGNFIGTDITGASALPNNCGIKIDLSGARHIIGESNGGVGGGPGNIGNSRTSAVVNLVSSLGNLISGNIDNGIQVTSGDNEIAGNYIGTNLGGTAALPNTGNGILINGAGFNFVGGTTAAQRNLISGNMLDGVAVLNASGNVVKGNFIGTNAAGTGALGNGGNGVRVSNASFTLVGGGVTGEGNVISANGAAGVFVLADASNCAIQGNRIGTDVNGTLDLGNTTDGVAFNSAPNNLVGGTVAGEGNVISGNGRHGVAVENVSNSVTIRGNFIGTNSVGAALGNTQFGVLTDGTNTTIGGTVAGAGNVIAFNTRGIVNTLGNGNSFLGNSIHSNAGLGIDLDPVAGAVNPNDSGDGDVGTNDLQNYPVLTSAIRNINTTTVLGTLDSMPSSAFTIEFFSNPSCDPLGNGEGRTFLGSTLVNTDAGGMAAISFVPSVPVAAGQVVTATATNSNASTSEFSACVTVISTCSLAVTTSTLPPGKVGAPYSELISTTGGTSPVTVTVSGVPPGLAFTSGLLQGVPTAQGTFNLFITATDSTLSCQATRSLTLSITCDGASVTNPFLADAVVKQAYSATINATGGTSPYIFDLVSGSLPNGLTLNGTTGQISGTPTRAGSFPFSVRVNPAVGCSTTQPFTIVVKTTPPQVTVTGRATNFAGGAPATFTVATVSDIQDAAGQLQVTVLRVPRGLTVETANRNGTVTATASAGCGLEPASYTVSFQVTDSDGDTAESVFEVVISANVAPTLGAYQDATLSSGLTLTRSPASAPADSNNDIKAVSAAPADLPGGGTVAVNRTTGDVTISTVTATTPGSYLIEVTVEDNCGQTAKRQFTLTVFGRPSAPTTLRAVAVGSRQVDLNWTDTSDSESAFVVERRTDGGGFVVIATTAPNTTNLTDRQVSPATNYTYRVKSTNAVGSSDPSNEATVRTPGEGQPVVTSFFPVAAASGKTITILGSGFAVGNTQVFFGGANLIPAEVSSVEPTRLTVVVPSSSVARNVNGFLTIRVAGRPDGTSQGLPTDTTNPGDPATALFSEFVLVGDLDKDGIVGASDLTVLRAVVLRQIGAADRQRFAGDVFPLNANGSRGDGLLTGIDVTTLQAVILDQIKFRRRK